MSTLDNISACLRCPIGRRERKTRSDLDEAIGALFEFVETSEARARADGATGRAAAFSDVLAFMNGQRQCASVVSATSAACAEPKP